MSSIYIRDRREKGWLWLDGKVIDEYMPHIGAAGLLVYTVICRHANNETQQAFPSLDYLTKKTRLHKNTVIEAIDRLEKCKLVSIKRGGGRGNPNIYTLLKVVPYSTLSETVQNTAINSTKKAEKTVQNRTGNKTYLTRLNNKGINKEKNEEPVDNTSIKKVLEETRQKIQKNKNIPTRKGKIRTFEQVGVS